jgi:hypothetical protein
LLASFCASVGRKDGGSGSRAFLIAGSTSAARDAGVEDSAGGMQVYMLSGCAAAGGAAPKSEHFDLFKGNLMITPLRCPGGNFPVITVLLCSLHLLEVLALSSRGIVVGLGLY